MSMWNTDVRVQDLGIVLGVYAVSTALYAALGMTFDDTTNGRFMQFIDPVLLQKRLLESLWYYHANPPLMNLLVGVTGKMFGGYQHDALSVVFHALGLLTGFSVYLLALRFTNSRLAAGIAAALLLFSPGFVLYENWLMYTMLATGLLTMAAFALYQYMRARSTRWCVIFFALLATLLLTRSLFHITWMILIIALLASTSRAHRRQVLRAAAVPLLIVALWYGKNLYHFGTFSSSTWMGLGFSNISTLGVPREELQKRVEQRELSPLALVSRYRDIDLLFTAKTKPTGIPILDQPIDSTGFYNFNYQPIIALSRQYMKDGLRVARLYPHEYLVCLGLSNELFFSPDSVSPYFHPQNRRASAPLERIFNPLLYGTRAGWTRVDAPHFGFAKPVDLFVNTSIPLILLWVIVLSYGCVQVARGARAQEPAAQARAIVIGFVVVTALYTYVIGTTVEMGENYRYRYLTEPLLLVLTIDAIAAMIRVLREGRRQQAATSTPENAT